MAPTILTLLRQTQLAISRVRQASEICMEAWFIDLSSAIKNVGHCNRLQVGWQW